MNDMGTLLFPLMRYNETSKTFSEEVKLSLLTKTKDIFGRIDKLRVAKSIGAMALGAINPAVLPILSGVSSIVNEGKQFLKGDNSNPEVNGFTPTRREIDSFQEDFNELVSQSGLERIVVYIDELDRCNSDTILSTLEAIRLFLFIKTTVFVIGADERHVKNAVVSKFGSDRSNHISVGKEYLEKMIQYPIRIPSLDISSMEMYVLLLFLNRDLDISDFDTVLEYISEERKKDVLGFSVKEEEISKLLKSSYNVAEILSISKNIAYILTNNLDGNPRQVKRFLNTLEIRKHYAISVDVKLNDAVMLKLMILEYFRPKIYTFLQKQHQKSSDELSTELSSIEEGGMSVNSMFSTYKEDDWLMLWFKLKPQLNGIDLSPYFYFSREGMSAIKSIGDIVPPIVESIINSVSTGGQTNMRIAFETLPQLTHIELTVLIEEIVKVESQNDTISLDNFRLLNEIIIQKPDKFTDCSVIFKAINGKDLKPSFVFVIKDTIERIKSSLKGDFIEICHKWQEENKKISLVEGEV